MKKRTVATLLCAMLAAACQKQDDGAAAAAAMRVSVVQARAVEFSPLLRLGGNWVARDEIALTPALQGQQIVSVHAEAGDAVKKGQLLAVLEPENVQSQLRQNSAQLNRAKANLNAQQAGLKEAQTLFQSYQVLVESGAISRQEFNEQQAKLRTAQANVQAARAEIAQMQALADDSRHQRAKAQILAPADGVITRRNAEAGALSGADALFYLAKDGQIELEAQANADELALLKTGLAVRLPGQPETPAGSVRLIYPAIDSASRTGKIRIAFERAPLPIGAYSEAEIALDKRQVAQALPFSAVSFGSDGVSRVKVVGADGKVAERKIETGARYQNWVEVRSGLKKGERVVKQAAAFVSDGDTVAPQLVQE